MTIEEMILELKDREVNIVSYDTWGNQEDGYDVNDLHRIQSQIELDQWIFEQDFGPIDAFEVDESADFGDDVYEIIETVTCKPVGRIEVCV